MPTIYEFQFKSEYMVYDAHAHWSRKCYQLVHSGQILLDKIVDSSLLDPFLW